MPSIKFVFLAVSDPSILSALQELAIRIEFDKEGKTITITDSGIGMTKNELINNLGTIAKSGTTGFVEALAKKENTLNLIGQFGVGFYAAFLAGNKVVVTSKSNDDDQYIWESSAGSSFTITKDPEGNTLKRGTKIVIHLKQDAYEFCEQDSLKSLIKKYSEFINFPIYLKVQKEITREVEVEEKPEDEKKDDDVTVKDDDDQTEKKPKTETVKETVWDWEVINDNKALWLRPREEIEEEEYNKFYKSIAKDYEDPLTYIHFVAEGDIEFKSILFIPKRAPFDMFENYYQKSSSLKLYVRRVLISEKFEDLMPKYLNFIKGVIDSDDLPINVSRESLQQLKLLKAMGRKVVKKALEMIKKLAEDKEDDDEEEESDSDSSDSDASDDHKQEKQDQKPEDDEEATKKKDAERKERYNSFWKEFGKNLKLGIIEDASNRQKLAELTRWHTTHDVNGLSSLDEYIERMKDNQDHIYFMGGENRDTLLKQPIVKALIAKGYEVLLLDDPVDEFVMQHLTEYEKKRLTNIAKSDFQLPTDDVTAKKTLKKLKKMYEPLTEWWKGLLKEQLDSVTVSDKLVEDPCVVVATSYGYSAYMEKIQKAQTYGNNNPMSNSKRILEINPHHPAIKELLNRVNAKDEEQVAETETLASLLYEAAAINSGYTLSDPHEFSQRFFKVFNGALGIPKDAKVEQVEVDLDDDDDEPVENDVKATFGDGGEPVEIQDVKVEYGKPNDDL